MGKKKILIADDEKRLVELIADFLKAADFDTVTAFDGEEAYKKFSENKDIDLCVLDIMMPEKDGWELLRDIRKTSNVPVIMLSARSEEFDMLNSFEEGADEYVTKPFSPAVLVKRIDALIKRNSGETVLNTEKKGLYIDKDAYTAFFDGKPLNLTVKEFELLSYLYDNKGRVLSRDQLLDAVWGYDYVGDSRTVDSNIARLRTKLGEFGITFLKTVYGFGYKIEG